MYPAGIWCKNDVVLTLMRRDDVASTLIRRHFRTKCPLGKKYTHVFWEAQFEIFAAEPLVCADFYPYVDSLYKISVPTFSEKDNINYKLKTGYQCVPICTIM